MRRFVRVVRAGPRRTPVVLRAAVMLVMFLLLLAPSSAHAGVWWSVSLSAEVIDGQGAPAQGVPVAYSFDDWLNPDEGVMVTGSDGTVSCRHWGSEDDGFFGGFMLALDDPHGVYSLLRTESDGFFGDEDNAWLHKTYYLVDAGVIAGVVRDVSGAPLAGVDVELFVSASDSSLQRVVRVVSDQVGHYRFAGLGSRSYAVRFSYGSPHGPRFWGGSADPASARLIVLGQDEERAGIDGAPGPPQTSSLTGRVAPRRGAGVPGLTVHVWRVGADGSLEEWPATIVTGEGGVFTASGLDAGDYTLSADLQMRTCPALWLGNVRRPERALVLAVGWDEEVVAPDVVVPRNVVRGPRRGR